ncbi:MAG: sugar transporter ATP-binding protein [Proteobacteria bacterium]|nr:sugar transporter ATP-binding protein [Pseudomonadota bacterium]
MTAPVLPLTPVSPPAGASDFLVLEAISKGFPGVQALDGAGLGVRAGEIHGVVGENGAGKSTLIKVLAGVYRPDAGRILLNGAEIETGSPDAVQAAGVRFIHQELNLVPHFTVAETIFLGQELSGPFGLRTGAMRRAAEAFLKDSLDAAIAGNRLIADLGIAERKLVQIARALIDGKARVVVFDEPTAPLSHTEIEHLFRAIDALARRGIAMIYVSHYLSEITRICHRVSVLRNGRNVGLVDPVGPDDADRLISLMVGRDIGDLYPKRNHAAAAPWLKLTSLSQSPHYADVDLELRRGEIVGLAGLIGSGREELVDTIVGLARPASGSISIDGRPLRSGSTAAAAGRGLAHVPRDRRNDGLVLAMNVADNINLASLEAVSTGGFVRRGAATTRAQQSAEALDIRPKTVSTAARLLSGGNQQKVVLARGLATGASLFVLDEPTIGVDVGAKAEIYALIERLAAEGAAVLVSSSDPAELLGLCDRILVLLRGRIVAEVTPETTDLDRLVALTTGGDAAGGIAA